MSFDNPDHVYGCYCYSAESGHTVVHVFVDEAAGVGVESVNCENLTETEWLLLSWMGFNAPSVTESRA